MHPQKTIIGSLLFAGMVLLFLIACAKPYHFYVKYDLPETTTALKGQKVFLQVQDGRESTTFLSDKAQKEFDMWDGTFAMYHTQKKPSGVVETHQLTGLLEAAMQKRLETMGITVITTQHEDVPLFEVTLKKLFLDLKERTWVSDFSYQVKMTKDNLKIGREQVSAQAERTKVMGKGAGEILIGDIFTESINKVNIEKLFKNAGLI